MFKHGDTIFHSLGICGKIRRFDRRYLKIFVDRMTFGPVSKYPDSFVQLFSDTRFSSSVFFMDRFLPAFSIQMGPLQIFTQIF